MEKIVISKGLGTALLDFTSKEQNRRAEGIRAIFCPFKTQD